MCACVVLGLGVLVFDLLATICCVFVIRLVCFGVVYMLWYLLWFTVFCDWRLFAVDLWVSVYGVYGVVLMFW